MLFNITNMKWSVCWVDVFFYANYLRVSASFDKSSEQRDDGKYLLKEIFIEGIL